MSFKNNFSPASKDSTKLNLAIQQSIALRQQHYYARHTESSKRRKNEICNEFKLGSSRREYMPAPPRFKSPPKQRQIGLDSSAQNFIQSQMYMSKEHSLSGDKRQGSRGLVTQNLEFNRPKSNRKDEGEKERGQNAGSAVRENLFDSDTFMKMPKK